MPQSLLQEKLFLKLEISKSTFHLMNTLESLSSKIGVHKDAARKLLELHKELE